MSLAKLAGSERLAPWDAKVARALRQERDYSRRWEIDRAVAIMALIGHPAVVLGDAPEQLIDVVEGTPEVEVVKDGERYLMRVTPPVRTDDESDDESDDRDWRDPAAERDAEALRMITLVRDTPQRLRVIRLTAAQRRAAQLVAGRFAVPASAHDDLQRALRALAGHFEVHADHAQAARDVAAESRLRAELSPIGEHLKLHLVVAPLGADGPRVAPGVGRARLMATVGGETVGTRRDLAAERAHLEAVLDALPFLDEPRRRSGGCEWLIADPEHALSAVEALPALAAVAAVDWPKGKPVRVVTVDVPPARRSSCRASATGSACTGARRSTRTPVLDFETLLAAARSASRFVPMGEGVYVALTRTLKSRLGRARGGRRNRPQRRARAAPRRRVAATKCWMRRRSKPTPRFAARSTRCTARRTQTPVVPKALQAELRPYQEEGYRWAMRLASAGLGGLSRRRHGARQDAAGARGAARARRRRRRAGDRADVGVRQLGRRGAALRADAQCRHLRRGRARRAGGQRRRQWTWSSCRTRWCSRRRSASPRAAGTR